MFGPPGVAYVYLVYGMYDCLNVVAGPDGRAGAVLLRAAEPLEGAEEMRAALADLRADRSARGNDEPRRRPVPDHRVAAGPGLLAGAMSVDRGCNGLDLCDPGSLLRLALAAEPPGREVSPDAWASGPRIGVAYAAEPWASAPLRFVDPTSVSLSRPVPPAGRSTLKAAAAVP